MKTHDVYDPAVTGEVVSAKTSIGVPHFHCSVGGACCDQSAEREREREREREVVNDNNTAGVGGLLQCGARVL